MQSTLEEDRLVENRPTVDPNRVRGAALTSPVGDDSRLLDKGGEVIAEKEVTKRATAEVDESTWSTASSGGGNVMSSSNDSSEASHPPLKKSKTGRAITGSSDVGSDGATSSRSNDEESVDEGVSHDDDGDGDGEEGNDDEVGDDDDQSHNDNAARGLNVGNVESDEEADEDAGDEALFRLVLAAARAQGIPLEYLAERFGLQFQEDGDDDGADEQVEYPFDTPPTSLEDVATFIQSEKCKRILVLAGAGMSVASGIPDFRSSDGLYATLDASRLTATTEQQERIREDPCYSLDQHLFLENPLPCLEVNREFILGVRDRKWKATLAHRFVELLRSKTGANIDGHNGGKLVRLYTQNIDGLEDQCQGLGHQHRIAVHGSMDEAECASCHATMDFDEFCDKVQRQIKDMTGQDATAPEASTPIRCLSCGAASMKPSIVLFRSRLPDVFFQNVPRDVKDVDLLIVMGTSLAVAPANTIVMRVPKSAMRVLINRDPVGWHLGLDWDSLGRDYFARGDCETVVLNLMDKLGWLEELRPLLETSELPESSASLLRERLELLQSYSSDSDSSTCSDKKRRASDLVEKSG